MTKFGIEETKQIIDFADFVVDEIVKLKENDEDISFNAIVSALVGNPDIAFKAIWGSWNIDDEIADLDQEEIKELIIEVLPIIKKVADLFI